VVALALGLVYLIVVPSLRQRLVDTKLAQLRAVVPSISKDVTNTEFDWQDQLQTWSSRAGDARVVIYQLNSTSSDGRPASITSWQDSHTNNSADVTNDPIAQKAASTFKSASGTSSRSDNEYAEVAVPVAMKALPSGGVLLLSASVHDAIANVDTVQRRLLEAGLLALVLALVVGYGAASLFARRIRRLEAAAERIAAGSFDEPVVDNGSDELAQLARAFDRMRLRLSQLERARREFVGNASHELRTPLFSLHGFIELLMDEDIDEATRREFLETMRGQVVRLQRLAEDLLDLTRLDAGRMHLERRPVDLAELAEELFEEFRAVAVSTGHPLELDASPAAALGDEERIIRVGRALVENALKHTAPGTPVRIRSGKAELAIEDDGPGIPTEYHDQVFARFYRVDGAQASGSGLGLAIAKELAEAMGGTLTLATGNGVTIFTLHLPPATPTGELPFSRETAVATG
jgi:signal transduction histidine kinase